jgi:hypothetical protein
MSPRSDEHVTRRRDISDRRFIGKRVWDPELQWKAIYMAPKGHWERADQMHEQGRGAILKCCISSARMKEEELRVMKGFPSLL